MIESVIYTRITEFKAKYEIIKMSRNYGNVAKKIWRVKYVYQHHAYDNYKAEM